MAEQLSAGAKVWYEEAKKARQLQEHLSLNSDPYGEWSHLFKELEVAKNATTRTYQKKEMDQQSFHQIRMELRFGFAALSAAYNYHRGRLTTPERINRYTMDAQTRAYEPLFHFLHPEDSIQLNESENSGKDNNNV